VTRNGGESWESISLPDGLNAFWMAIDPAASNILYATTYQGLYRSTDGGQNWIRSLSGADTLTQIVVSPADPSTVYADAYDAQHRRVFYRSADRGLTWTPVSQIPGGSLVVSMVAGVRDTRTIYLSAGGMFRSRDGGATWERMEDGLPPWHVRRLALSSNGTVLHATSDRGMWRLALTGRRRAVR
jgi:photosystem II stability/assembly factor-like uncharacterized protein